MHFAIHFTASLTLLSGAAPLLLTISEVFNLSTVYWNKGEGNVGKIVATISEVLNLSTNKGEGNVGKIVATMSEVFKLSTDC